jgi:hypothetical protein
MPRTRSVHLVFEDERGEMLSNGETSCGEDGVYLPSTSDYTQVTCRRCKATRSWWDRQHPRRSTGHES